MRPYSIFVLDYVPNESCFKLFYNQFFIFVMFDFLSDCQCLEFVPCMFVCTYGLQED